MSKDHAHHRDFLVLFNVHDHLHGDDDQPIQPVGSFESLDDALIEAEQFIGED